MSAFGSRDQTTPSGNEDLCRWRARPWRKDPSRQARRRPDLLSGADEPPHVPLRAHAWDAGCATHRRGATGGKVSRVGFMFFGAPGPSAEADAFRQGMYELGYREGQNLTVEYRFASGQVERLHELATELARLKVDVIVTTNTPSAMAAKQATSTIPIVFAVVADAVGAGLISNFARPGGNITGLTSISAELSGKRLELLKEIVPKASRLAVLYNPSDRSNVLMLKQIQESAPTLRSARGSIRGLASDGSPSGCTARATTCNSRAT